MTDAAARPSDSVAVRRHLYLGEGTIIGGLVAMVVPRVARLVRDVVAQWPALLTGSGLILVAVTVLFAARGV